MKENADIDRYGYTDPEQNSSPTYLLPDLRKELTQLDGGEKRLFDLGCGNGSVGATVSRTAGTSGRFRESGFSADPRLSERPCFDYPARFRWPLSATRGSA